jgi:hypothetical protein
VRAVPHDVIGAPVRPARRTSLRVDCLDLVDLTVLHPPNAFCLLVADFHPGFNLAWVLL